MRLGSNIAKRVSKSFEAGITIGDETVCDDRFVAGSLMQHFQFRKQINGNRVTLCREV